MFFSIRDDLTKENEPIIEESLFDIIWKILNNFSFDCPKSKIIKLPANDDNNDEEIATY